MRSQFDHLSNVPIRLHRLARLLAGACVACSAASVHAQEDAGKKQPEEPVNPQPVPAVKPSGPTKPAPTPGFQPVAPSGKPGVTPPNRTGVPTSGAEPNPAGDQATVDLPPLPPDPDYWTINTTGEINLADFIRYVQRELKIQILFADASIQDQKIVLTAPLRVRKEQILDFLARLLESKGYTIFKDDFDIFTVTPTAAGQPIGNGIARGDLYAATQIIDCKGIKPSSISNYIPALGTGGAGGQIVPLDEFGVIIVTDTSARTRLIRDFVDQLVKLRDGVLIIPLDVTHISAATARDRILSLTGESAGNTGSAGLNQQGAGGVPKPGNLPGGAAGLTGGGTGTTSNLAAQLSVSPFSNAIFFRGRPEESSYVRQLLALVDVPNRMEARFYDIGIRAAEIISAMGTREGLGEVTTQEASADTSGSPLASAGRLNQQLGQPVQPGAFGAQQASAVLSGSAFVLFPEPGGFMYYGTEAQHERVNHLIEKNKALSVGEQVVYKFYKIKNGKAIDIADIITSLVTNQQPLGNTGGIIGDDLRGSGSSRRNNSRNRNRNQDDQSLNQANRGSQGSAGAAGGIGGIEADDGTFVMADEKQNQIIVKTRSILQPEFAKLIEKLDARRPQVYISAQIVAVTGSENFRLAFEQQWLAGQFALNTNFGLGGIPSTGTIQDRKTVATNLPGLTAAIIRSDTVPLIITALQNNSDTRVLANPQLLVDDNEEATITSENVVPTQQTIDTDTGTTRTSVGESARAGTTLSVSPQISENGVKMGINVILSSFTGSPASPELPPPSQENEVDSQVTIPRDSTIVIGGLTSETIGNTVIKVPLLGDIPILGHLFRDQSKTTTKTTLYIFITPKIMSDPNSLDIRLLSQGPAREAKIKSEFMIPAPEMMSAPIDMPALPERTAPVESSPAPVPASAPASVTGTPIPPPPQPIEAPIPKTGE